MTVFSRSKLTDHIWGRFVHTLFVWFAFCELSCYFLSKKTKRTWLTPYTLDFVVTSPPGWGDHKNTMQLLYRHGGIGVLEQGYLRLCLADEKLAGLDFLIFWFWVYFFTCLWFYAGLLTLLLTLLLYESIQISTQAVDCYLVVGSGCLFFSLPLLVLTAFGVFAFVSLHIWVTVLLIGEDALENIAL